jgi:solute carrier family 25 phosphate transporter 23/24/25/41
VWLLLACGSTSSTLAQVVSYPLALVRTKLQAMKVKTADVSLNAGGIAMAHSPVRELTMTTMFKKIIREEGFQGLYRGITPNFIKVLPAVSISYISYELISQKLGIHMA